MARPSLADIFAIEPEYGQTKVVTPTRPPTPEFTVEFGEPSRVGEPEVVGSRPAQAEYTPPEPPSKLERQAADLGRRAVDGFSKRIIDLGYGIEAGKETYVYDSDVIRDEVDKLKGLLSKGAHYKELKLHYIMQGKVPEEAESLAFLRNAGELGMDAFTFAPLFAYEEEFIEKFAERNPNVSPLAITLAAEAVTWTAAAAAPIVKVIGWATKGAQFLGKAVAARWAGRVAGRRAALGRAMLREVERKGGLKFGLKPQESVQQQARIIDALAETGMARPKMPLRPAGEAPAVRAPLPPRPALRPEVAAEAPPEAPAEVAVEAPAEVPGARRPAPPTTEAQRLTNELRATNDRILTLREMLTGMKEGGKPAGKVGERITTLENRATVLREQLARERVKRVEGEGVIEAPGEVLREAPPPEVIEEAPPIRRRPGTQPAKALARPVSKQGEVIDQWLKENEGLVTKRDLETKLEAITERPNLEELRPGEYEYFQRKLRTLPDEAKPRAYTPKEKAELEGRVKIEDAKATKVREELEAEDFEAGHRKGAEINREYRKLAQEWGDHDPIFDYIINERRQIKVPTDSSGRMTEEWRLSGIPKLWLTKKPYAKIRLTNNQLARELFGRPWKKLTSEEQAKLMQYRKQQPAVKGKAVLTWEDIADMMWRDKPYSEFGTGGREEAVLQHLRGISETVSELRNEAFDKVVGKSWRDIYDLVTDDFLAGDVAGVRKAAEGGDKVAQLVMHEQEGMRLNNLLKREVREAPAELRLRVLPERGEFIPPPETAEGVPQLFETGKLTADQAGSIGFMKDLYDLTDRQFNKIAREVSGKTAGKLNQADAVKVLNHLANRAKPHHQEMLIRMGERGQLTEAGLRDIARSFYGKKLSELTAEEARLIQANMLSEHYKLQRLAKAKRIPPTTLRRVAKQFFGKRLTEMTPEEVYELREEILANATKGKRFSLKGNIMGDVPEPVFIEWFDKFFTPSWIFRRARVPGSLSRRLVDVPTNAKQQTAIIQGELADLQAEWEATMPKEGVAEMVAAPIRGVRNAISKMKWKLEKESAAEPPRIMTRRDRAMEQSAEKMTDYLDGNLPPETPLTDIERRIVQYWRDKLVNRYRPEINRQRAARGEEPIPEGFRYMTHMLTETALNIIKTEGENAIPNEILQAMRFLIPKVKVTRHALERVTHDLPLERNFWKLANIYATTMEKSMAINEVLPAWQKWRSEVGKISWDDKTATYIDDIINHQLLSKPSELDQSFDRGINNLLGKIGGRKTIKIPDGKGGFVDYEVQRFLAPQSVASKLVSKWRLWNYAKVFMGNVGQLALNRTQAVLGYAQMEGHEGQKLVDALYGEMRAHADFFKHIATLGKAKKFREYREAGIMRDFEEAAFYGSRGGWLEKAVIDLSMALMKTGEFLNRGAVTYARQRNALRFHQLSRDEALQLGIQLSDHINFRYGAMETPQWVYSAGPFGKLGYQFSSFATKYIEQLLYMGEKMKVPMKEYSAALAKGESKAVTFLKGLRSDERRQLLTYITALSGLSVIYDQIFQISLWQDVTEGAIPNVITGSFPGMTGLKKMWQGDWGGAWTAISVDPTTNIRVKADRLTRSFKGKTPQGYPVYNDQGRLLYYDDAWGAGNAAIVGGRAVGKAEYWDKMLKLGERSAEYRQRKLDILQLYLDGEDEKADKLAKRYNIRVTGADIRRAREIARATGQERYMRSIPEDLRRQLAEEGYDVRTGRRRRTRRRERSR